MKKITGLFLWFCAATVMAQGIIVLLSYLRGNIKPHTFKQLVATLNGIDIEGQRLKAAMSKPEDVPVPTREEVIAARAQKSLEFDQRERSLIRFQEQLESTQAKLKADIKDLDSRRLAFEEAEAARAKNKDDQTLGEVQRILELLPPDQASKQLEEMVDKSPEDVVAIVKALPDDKRTKILREFAQSEKFSKVLGDIRAGVGLDSASVTNPAP